MSTNPLRLNKYELKERLGHGGMAEVWKALDTQLQRYVAIKILHPDLQSDPNFFTRFEREAQLVASLHHPNIIQIYDFHISHPPETTTTVVYMVMDYVEGQTMAQYLRQTARVGKFPSAADIVHLFTPICLAVDYAHQKGMIHRDIKPSNILLDKRSHAQGLIGEPILSDFGIAKLLGASTSSHSGWWLGTPYYISPEQALGEPGNERSDIYALSIILYETCTGKLPFQGDNPTAIIMQHIKASPIAPTLANPNIPPALAAVILRGLAKDPGARHPSASSMGMAIAEALHMPVADSLKQTAYQLAEMNNPTYISPIRSEIVANLAPPAVSPSPSSTHSDSSLAAPKEHGWPAPVPADSVLGASPTPSSAVSGSLTPPSPPLSTPASISSSPAHTTTNQSQQAIASSPSLTPTKRRKGSIITTILLAIVLIGASMGTLLVLAASRSTPSSPPSDQVLGHAFFVNSGQLNPDNSQGINDELLLDLHNIPDPPASKAYYAWLLGDKTPGELATTALGLLSVNHGEVHLFYQGNQQHTNMLAYESRILITVEDASVTPATYTPDYRAWRYYAQLSQAPSPKDKLHFSMLDHLRHLLSESPELKIRGLHGGLDMWFLRNTQKILEWANAARDDWRNSPDLLHRQIIRILDYLDGESFVQQDAPAVGSVLLVDAHDAQVALLGQPPDGQDPPGYAFDDEVPPGYVYLVSSHLAGTVLSPDATPDQRALAAQIHNALDKTKSWLEQVQQDAKRLVTMDATQLAQPSTLSILDDMVTQTQFAYLGQADPLTGQLQGGAIWICNNIQRMANFDIKPYRTT